MLSNAQQKFPSVIALMSCAINQIKNWDNCLSERHVMIMIMGFLDKVCLCVLHTILSTLSFTISPSDTQDFS